MTHRPELQETIFEIAEAWERRSTCSRGSAGAVIVLPSGGVLSQGYNGSPRGLPHCSEAGCLVEKTICTTCRGFKSVVISPTEAEYEKRLGDPFKTCPVCNGSGEGNGHCIRSVHAEMNAIIWAARQGIRLNAGRLYSTVRPCIRCANAIIQAGITAVYFDRPYNGDDYDVVAELFRRAGVQFMMRERQ